MRTREKRCKRLLSLLLAIVLCMSLALPAGAASSSNVRVEQADNSEVSARPSLRRAELPEEEPLYADTDTVRVSIVVSGISTIEYAASRGIELDEISADRAAKTYRSSLESKQAAVAAEISSKVLNGGKLDVVWNLSLAANIISANVKYGQIAQIASLSNVEDVVVEPCFEADTDSDGPDMATSPVQTGSSSAWAAGYTGAGSRIAVIDSGTDTDHQSFSEEGFLYALKQLAGKANQSEEEYIASLNLLDEEQIAAVWDQLNIAKLGYKAEDTYLNAKLPFGFNYVDQDLDITHDNDSQGNHGSHVAGIATANAYIPDSTSESGFSSALETVKVQGVAPDAQLITMKVFGKRGGAYASDYLVAIEDAILLGADSINLSIGSGSPGMSTSTNAVYQGILDSLAEHGAVVVMSAGNTGAWPEGATTGGYLYADDVSMQTDGQPGSFTNTLAVASVDNAGFTGECITVGKDQAVVFYAQPTKYSNEPLTTLLEENPSGSFQYIFFNGYGSTEAEFAAVGDALKGKIAVISRGGSGDYSNFSTKANRAVEAGAVAVIFYNNQSGTLSLGLSAYTETAPCISVSQEDGKVLQNAAKAVYDGEGNLLYRLGSLVVNSGVGSTVYDRDYEAISTFSSWGVPGSLELKPEITAPGGNIYSVSGLDPSGSAYETKSGTSMSAPQVTGMAALMAQYIREKGLEEKTGLTVRQLAQSLLMSTATPILEDYGEYDGWDYGDGYYPVLRQGAGLANVSAALSAETYIWMDENATQSYADGKVKAELGDDPEKTGTYSFSFTVHNLTDAEQTYDLSADLFTQDLFEDDGVAYMDTWTTPLEANAVWTVDGATGDRVTVPAGGSAAVSVTLTLTGAQKSALDQNYPNGAYVEGYLFLNAQGSEDEAQGVSHSIPVLGFYGDWSDASMFEKGSFTQYYFGEETRTPYLGDDDWSYYANAVYIQYAGDSEDYFFGGNPLLYDNYDPDRNAISAVNGDQLSYAYYALIRNAAGGLLTVTNQTQEKVELEEQLGETRCAYYDDKWYNAYAYQYLDFTPSGKEGDRYELKLTFATEYSVGEDGQVNWDALGKGASLSIPFTVDNTAPEILSADVADNILTVTARDNQYLSAVVLYSHDGTEWLADALPEQKEAGQRVDVELNLSELEAGVYLIQVYDYAMNVSTYRLFLNVEKATEVESVTVDPDGLSLLKGASAALTATVLPVNIEDNTVTWTSSDETVATVSASGVVTAVGDGTCNIVATANQDGKTSASCQVTVSSISKDLNGILWNEDYELWLTAFNTATIPDFEEIAVVSSDDYNYTGPFLTSLAYGPEGKLYAVDYDMNFKGNPSSLYEVAVEEGKLVVQKTIGELEYAVTDLAYLPSYGYLVGTSGNAVLILDPETGEVAGRFSGWWESDLVGIAYIDTWEDYDDTGALTDVDAYYLINADGDIWLECFADYGYGEVEATYWGYYYEEYSYVGSAGVRGAAGYLNSAYYDPDNGCLYWSAFFGEELYGYTELYAIAIEENYDEETDLFSYGTETFDLGTFGDVVYPVTGLIELIPASTPDPEPETYTVTFDSQGGTLVPSQTVQAGQKASEPADPTREGYTFVGWYLDGTLYDFDTPVTEDLTLAAGWTKNGDAPVVPVIPDVPDKPGTTTAPALPFTDVSENASYYDAVKYVYDNGLMNGTSETKFSPSAALDRAMVVTILHRLEGKPAVSYTGKFADVADGVWYTDGVEWAAKNGIVTGYTNGNYGPLDPVTREQLAAILYRYAEYKGYDVTKTANLTAYTDGAKVSEYAKTAVAWAAANGILESTNSALRPTTSATRAEVAIAIAAFHQKYVK